MVSLFQFSAHTLRALSVLCVSALAFFREGGGWWC